MLGVNAIWGTALYWVAFVIVGMIFQSSHFWAVVVLLCSLGSLTVLWYFQRSSRKFHLPWPRWPGAFLVPSLIFTSILIAVFFSTISVSVLDDMRGSRLIKTDAFSTSTFAAVLLMPFIFLVHAIAMLCLLKLAGVLMPQRAARAIHSKSHESAT